MRSRRPEGMGTALVLMALSLVLVLGLGATTMAFQHLNRGTAVRDAALAGQAALAGAEAALRELKADDAWTAGFAATTLNASQSWSVQVTNNVRGTSTATAPNGATVPPGTAYLLARGTARDGRIERTVGVLVRKVHGRFPHAVGLGGDMAVDSTTFRGTVKMSGGATATSAMAVVPQAGQGRFLTTGTLNLGTKGRLDMDPAQDVRARGSIVSPSSIRGTTLVYSADSSWASNPFVADGRLTNDPPEGYEVLPNPDPALLLDPGTLVDHGSTTSVTGVFDLQGKVHYFPNGVTFQAGASLVGRGTLVTGNGSTLQFDCPLGSNSSYQDVNLLALDGAAGTAGGARIRFMDAVFMNGLAYSHGSVSATANTRIRGALYCYPQTTGDLDASDYLEVLSDDLAVPVAGFDPWLTGGGLEVQSRQAF